VVDLYGVSKFKVHTKIEKKKMNKISKAYSTNGGMDNDVPIVYVGGII